MEQKNKVVAKNSKVGLYAFAFVIMMIGVAYASVPLYKLFCQVTGFGGTTQRAEAAPDTVGTRMIKVEFDASVNAKLPWQFKPKQRSIDLAVGARELAYYEAKNLAARATTGTALFNVTPLKAGQYFNKIECFCFNEQELQPGETVDMPVSFFIDPAIVDDPNMKEVKTITLSYTFFKVEE